MKKMQVYQLKLIENIRKTLSEWLSSNEEIPASEVRRFFHSVSGTAPTIELDEIGNIAAAALKLVDNRPDENWSRRTLQEKIAPLLKECYQFQYENEMDYPINADSTDRSKIVFLVERDTDFLIYIKDYLERKGFHVFAFTDCDKAISALYDIKPDCILLDILHERENDLDRLSQMTKTVKTQYVPVMVISDISSDTIRMASYKKGADDFISKPFILEELYVRMNRQIERKGFVDHLILVDELTGLYNRKYLLKSFTQLCSRQWEEDQNLSIAFLDLDHFKSVNDQHGHLTGDAVLKGFSQFVRKRLRPEESLIRYGGEEFVLLAPNLSAEECKNRLDKILKEFSSLSFKGEQGKEFACTFSSGIAEVDATVSTSLSYWLDLADLALYTSKENGRKQVTIFNRSMSSSYKTVAVALLEDDPIMQVLLTNTIKQAAASNHIPVEITRFDSGEELLESGWMDRHQKGMVFLNIFMAGMNGIETLQQADFKNFTVLMLSAETRKTEMIQAIELGVADYVIKPFSINSLENKILFYLNKFADH
ncbi:diguanylate cyclase domain-containing protein [Bacillus sp. AK031]